MNKKHIMMLMVLTINKVLISEIYDCNPYGFFEKLDKDEEGVNQKQTDEELMKKLQLEEYYLLKKQRAQESADSMYAQKIEKEQREKANKEKEFQKLMRNAINVLEGELRKLCNASTPEEAAKRLRYIAKVATDRAKHTEKY